MPEFGPGDEIMLISPVGAPPFPEGPATVIDCIQFNEATEEAVYLVEYENGVRALADGVEVWLFAEWLEWMRVNAN